jgi:hypothetical protein
MPNVPGILPRQEQPQPSMPPLVPIQPEKPEQK